MPKRATTAQGLYVMRNCSTKTAKSIASEAMRLYEELQKKADKTKKKRQSLTFVRLHG